MKKQHLIALVVLLAFLGAGIYALHYSTSSAGGGAHPVGLSSPGADGVPPDSAVTSGDDADVGSEIGLFATSQYVDSAESDTSLYGDNARIYRTYDNETLEAIAEGGDLLAIKLRAHRLIDNPPSDDSLDGLEMEEELKLWREYKQKKKKYLELALVYGDVEFIDAVGNMYVGAYDIRDPEQVRKTILEKLALLEFTAMRGAQTKKYSSAPDLIKEYSEYLDGPLALTGTDKSYIRDRAQAIYNDYENQRIELGLGAFEDIDEDYSHIPGYDPFQDYLEAMGDNAF